LFVDDESIRFPFRKGGFVMFKLVGDGRDFETLDEALEAAESEQLDATVLDSIEDVVARYRPGFGVEWPIGLLQWQGLR
jgi:hypothetical protein